MNAAWTGCRPSPSGEALDRRDLGAVGLSGQHGAALHRLAVHVHGARAAVGRVAADVRARQAELVAQPVTSSRRLHVRGSTLAVDGHLDVDGGAHPDSSRCVLSSAPDANARLLWAAMVTRSFQFEGTGWSTTSTARAPRSVVLPGLLFSRKMHRPLAEQLGRGHRVLCLDLLGHGDSDRPPEMWNYGMSIFGRQTIALLDHAGVDKAVIGGTSLGPTRRSRPRRRARPREGDADRDAGARQRAARVRAGVHAAARRADVRGAGGAGVRLGRARSAAGKLASATCCSTG